MTLGLGRVFGPSGRLSWVLMLIDGRDSADITDLQLTTKKTAEDVVYVKDILESKIEEEERVSIRKWLHPDGINSETGFATALEVKESETGRWLLDSEDFTAWKRSVNGCMWLYGIRKQSTSFLLTCRLC